MPYKKLHQADKFRDEEHKCEDDKPENGVPEDFSDDVTVQDAHGANGECSTAATAIMCGAFRSLGPECRSPLVLIWYL